MGSPRDVSRRMAVWVAALLVPAGGSAWAQALEELAELRPAPELSAEEVVRIQMEAFRNNDEEDTGIAIAFRFASPGNRQMTGPLSRFRMMMRNPFYRPMLNAEAAEIGLVDVRERVARVEVYTVAPGGERNYYAFFLGKQRGGEYDDSWMTEAVEVIPDDAAAPDGSV
ncbi:MAG: DUF4864 domain-containing protein [Spirochaetaceae bacterium]